jgi:phosphohistidine phosphatase
MPPPRTLYLLRHAKSSWADPSLADRDRPLAPRGRRNAAVLAARLARAPIAPDLVLCSPALRARETLAAIGDALPPDAETRVEERLYGASADELAALLAELPGAVRAVLLIGHNPGIEELAGLLDPRVAHEPVPTAALLTVELDGPFAAVGAGRARLVGRVVPR